MIINFSYMYTNKIIWIIGHWESANMGDKYQPYVIAHTIGKTLGVDWKTTQPDAKMNNIYFINFSDDDGRIMETTINNVPYRIYHPHDPILKPADLAILTTGSMDGGSPYVDWVKKYLENGYIKNIIVWGGFSRGDDDFDKFMKPIDFITNDNVVFFARSKRDLDIYDEIIKNNINKTNNGRLAGDPMCWYVTDEGKDFGNLLETLNKPEDLETFYKIKGNVVVPSIFAFEWNNTFWTKICDAADKIICIDTCADYNILKKYKNKTMMIREPWIFIDIIKNAKHVLNGRLHSSVLATCSNIPTTLLITDDADPGKGSFKFDAVGNTAISMDDPICRVAKVCDYGCHNDDYKFDDYKFDDYSKYFASSIQYVALTLNSLDTISQLSHSQSNKYLVRKLDNKSDNKSENMGKQIGSKYNY